MSSNESSSNSSASGSQGTGLWVTAAVAMAIIVGGPLLIDSGHERGHRRGAIGQAVDQEPATALVSSTAGGQIESPASVGAATGGDREPAVSTGGGGIAFSPGKPVTAKAVETPIADAVALPAQSEPPAGPKKGVVEVGSSVGSAEPVVAEPGASHAEPSPSKVSGTEPTVSEAPGVESAGEAAAGPPVTGEETPPPPASVSATVFGTSEPPEAVESSRAAPRIEEAAGAESAEVPSRDQPVQPSVATADKAAEAKGETQAGPQTAPVAGSLASSRLTEVMAELRSLQRQAEMEKRASGGPGYAPYGRPYYPSRPSPRVAPGGYGYNRQGPPRYYPPQGRPWGYPGPVPQGAGPMP